MLVANCNDLLVESTPMCYIYSGMINMSGKKDIRLDVFFTVGLKQEGSVMEMDAQQRFRYHFEPEKGWMNDPNGLIFYRGQYHAFFQHYPYAPQWGQMHWGHAVSDDLLHWQELPIALYPDMWYEDEGGCFSGSAVEKDGRLYLFYTSVSRELKQSQSVAYSDDGIHFTKYEGNPVIPNNPLGYADFRDPKVSCIDGTWYMVVGSGDETSGKVLLFTSEDLLKWEYAGILFEGKEFAPCIECPDFFKLGQKYVLMFSKIGKPERSAWFLVGDFVDGKLVNYTVSRPEWGIDFYAPQTFLHGKRRIMIGWMYHWGKKAPEGCPRAGALTIPRELTLEDDRIRTYPVAEVRHLLKGESAHVRKKGDQLVILDAAGKEFTYPLPEVHQLEILEDTKAVEVFVNQGEFSVTQWYV